MVKFGNFWTNLRFVFEIGLPIPDTCDLWNPGLNWYHRGCTLLVAVIPPVGADISTPELITTFDERLNDLTMLLPYYMTKNNVFAPLEWHRTCRNNNPDSRGSKAQVFSSGKEICETFLGIGERPHLKCQYLSRISPKFPRNYFKIFPFFKIFLKFFQN